RAGSKSRDVRWLVVELCDGASRLPVQNGRGRQTIYGAGEGKCGSIGHPRGARRAKDRQLGRDVAGESRGPGRRRRGGVGDRTQDEYGAKGRDGGRDRSEGTG